MLHLYEILQGYNLMESTGFNFTTQLYKQNICNLQVYDISITFSTATGFWVIVIAMSSNQVYNARSQVQFSVTTKDLSIYTYLTKRSPLSILQRFYNRLQYFVHQQNMSKFIDLWTELY